MNKSELISDVADRTNLSKKDAANALGAVLDVVADSLAQGETVSLVGFGNFSVSRRNARTGRNPQTGAEIHIPARNLVKFSSGKALKDAVQ
ncbi:MAG: DNA-binding protein HU [Opitutae bacterium]|nr:DNA-binding protein HU [Opitutae bacterium]